MTSNLPQPASHPNDFPGFYHDGVKFYYEDELSAGHQHPRCAAQELYALLTYTAPAPTAPVLTKSGTIAKRQVAPHKDSPVHFYAAQAWHYGLQKPKPVKGKEYLKKRLLAAFQNSDGDNKTGVLAVPPELLQLENELRCEYAAANKISGEGTSENANNKGKAKEVAHGKPQPARLVVAQGPVTKEELSREELHKGIDQIPEARLRMYVRELTTRNEGLRQAMESEVLRQRKEANAVIIPAEATVGYRTKQTAVKSSSGGSSRQRSPSPTRQAPRMKQTARRGGAVQTATRTTVVPMATRGRTKQTARKSTGGPRSRPRRATSIESGKPLSLDDITGTYDIFAPYLSDEWPDMCSGELTLSMAPSSTGSHLWAQFDFGIFSGVMRAPLPTQNVSGAGYPFTWRGQEMEGASTFGDGNTGTIVFLDGQGKNINGRMVSNLGTFKFEGTMVADNTGSRESDVQNWKGEYRGYNEVMYENANKARWGGWGGEDYYEEPAESDTTEGKVGSEDGSEDGDSDDEYGW